MSGEKPTDTGKVIWPEAKIGPFRYLVAGGESYEYKDGHWVDSKGRKVSWLGRPEKAAHRP
jgi:hypothetical protein